MRCRSNQAGDSHSLPAEAGSHSWVCVASAFRRKERDNGAVGQKDLDDAPDRVVRLDDDIELAVLVEVGRDR